MKAIALSLFILFAANAHGEKSVWSQLESGTVNAIDATVTAIELDGLRVTIKDSEGESKTLPLCTQDSAINGSFYTEADRALALSQRIQALRESKKSQQPVKVAVRGPWSPCLYPLDI